MAGDKDPTLRMVGRRMNPENVDLTDAHDICAVRGVNTATGTRLYIEIDPDIIAFFDDDTEPLADKTMLRDTVCEAIRRAFNDAMRLQ